MGGVVRFAASRDGPMRAAGPPTSRPPSRVALRRGDPLPPHAGGENARARVGRIFRCAHEMVRRCAAGRGVRRLRSLLAEGTMNMTRKLLLGGGFAALL